MRLPTTDNLGHVSIPTTFFRHVDTTSEEFENGAYLSG